VSDLEGDGLQEVRGPGAQGLNVTRRAAISRRQFLTGAFRRRDVAVSRPGASSTLRGDLGQGKPGERDRYGWNEERQFGRDFAAPETAPRIPDWDSGIDGVLAEMEDLKGIEDF
jgi:hypothetical protein